jgi:hypothetical protein
VDLVLSSAELLNLVGERATADRAAGELEGTVPQSTDQASSPMGGGAYASTSKATGETEWK